MTDVVNLNPAELAAAKAWDALKGHLSKGDSFVFEAGAGAGKTFSLIESLKFILARKARELLRNNQQVACITYTNVARDNIIAKTDGHPAIYCETTHGFAWNLISPFQKSLCEYVRDLPAWITKVSGLEQPDFSAARYELGRRDVEDGVALLHHDDIFPLFIRLMDSAKFRAFVTSKFPIILIDEYQDTDADLVASFKTHFLGSKHSPQFGFFGDHWQKIYGDGCGTVSHASLKRVDKNANFRSVANVVQSLNKIRPDLKQAPKDPDDIGVVSVFHTNGWAGKRQTRNHWQGDLESSQAAQAFDIVKEKLISVDKWDFGQDTKILMLTHRTLANKMGYSSLPTVFRYNDSFAKKANEVISYFNDHLEPAIEAFEFRKFGAMFEAFDARAPLMTSPSDKAKWSNVMNRLVDIRAKGTVGDMVEALFTSGFPIVSEAVRRLEREISTMRSESGEKPRRLLETEQLYKVKYEEIIALCKYLRGHSPFQTKHGVKGEQFENVLVVFGRGWNDYDFGAFLEMAASPESISDRDAYERYRNLFYVCVSRPQRRLSLLFTQRLSNGALGSLSKWFGQDRVSDVGHLLR